MATVDEQAEAQYGQELLECHICLSSMVNRKPRGLSCLHTFYQDCLEALCSDEYIKEITCPVCRKITQLSDGRVNDLPINFMINQLANRLPQEDLCKACGENEEVSKRAEVFCYTCRAHFCINCKIRHEAIAQYVDHEIVNIGKSTDKNKNICRFHNRRVDLFSIKCTQCLCSICALSVKHKGHEDQFQKLNVKYYEIKESILAKEKEIRDMCQEKTTPIAEAEEMIKKIKEMVEEETGKRKKKLEHQKQEILEKINDLSLPVTEYASKIECVKEKVNDQHIQDLLNEDIPTFSNLENITKLVHSEKVCISLLHDLNELDLPQNLNIKFTAGPVVELGQLSTEEVKEEIEDQTEVKVAYSEGTIRFTITDLNTVKGVVEKSSSFLMLLGLSLNIIAQEYFKDGMKALSVFLECRAEQELEPWSCSVIVDFRILRHTPGGKPYCRITKHVFCPKENDWGYKKFITWDELTDPGEGLCENGSVTLEANIKAGVRQVGDAED